MIVNEAWAGDAPTRCELCPNVIETIFVDGKTVYGGWAIMCPECHSQVGVGLGLGHGQKYEKQGGIFVLKEGEEITE